MCFYLSAIRPIYIIFSLILLSSCGGGGGDGGNNPNSPLVIEFAQTIRSNNPAGSYLFGAALDFNPNNNTLAVSELNANVDVLDGAGKVHIFNKNGTTWAYSESIQSPAPAANNDFGNAVRFDSSGAILAVGEPFSGGAGAVQLFTPGIDAWNYHTTIENAAGVNNSDFGSAIDFAANGNTLFVGEPDGVNLLGQVIAYTKGAAGWTGTVSNSVVTPNTPAQLNRFGKSLRISPTGEVLAVGEGDNDRVQIFNKAGANWLWDENLTSEAGSEFGNAMDFTADGAILAIAERASDVELVSFAGSVQIFRLQNNSWQRLQTLTSRSPEAGNNFGADIRFSPNGNLLAVGETSGKVHVFQRSNSGWARGPELTGTEGFGSAVRFSADGKWLAVSETILPPTAHTGLVHLYQINP